VTGEHLGIPGGFAMNGHRLMAGREYKAPSVVSPEAVAPLAAEFAAWRTGGCPGYGFAEAFKQKVRKTARAAGVPYADLWTAVHAAAYVLIDAA